MRRKTTEADKKYITDNWLKMFNKDIAKHLGIESDYLTVIAKRMGLPSKKNLVLEYKGPQQSKQIEEYTESFETKEEIVGRIKTAQLNQLKQKFNLYDELKIKTFIDINMHAVVIEGKVVQKTDQFIVLQTEKYKESFKYKDFFTKKAILMG